MPEKSDRVACKMRAAILKGGFADGIGDTARE
jgi:hypothetical protein